MHRVETIIAILSHVLHQGQMPGLLYLVDDIFQGLPILCFVMKMVTFLVIERRSSGDRLYSTYLNHEYSWKRYAFNGLWFCIVKIQNQENMSDISSTLCNITLHDSDLTKLQELDPTQHSGFKTQSQVTVPIHVTYTNELDQSVTDTQQMNIQILTKTVKSTTHKAHLLEQLQICLTSQSDLYFNYSSSINQEQFHAIKQKGELNVQFEEFPQMLDSLFRGGQNRVKLHLSYEGTGRLQIVQHTDYKELELVELFVVRSMVQKTHQSIIYRYNYKKSKLALLNKSIDSIYEILAQKNMPLLEYIQAHVGTQY